jgi:peptidoglycan/xylan/chitin deacetylase (PgdA/CDA1 family)
VVERAPGPGRDPLVDQVADALFDWGAHADRTHDWEDHQRARVVLDLLEAEGRLRDATSFRDLGRSVQVGVVASCGVLALTVASVTGLLAWAAVAAWGRVLG